MLRLTVILLISGMFGLAMVSSVPINFNNLVNAWNLSAFQYNWLNQSNFVNTCDNAEDLPEVIICSAYYEMLIELKNEHIFDLQLLAKTLNIDVKLNDTSKFCGLLHSVLPKEQKYLEKINKIDCFEELDRSCSIICLNLNGHVKPICRLVFGGFAIIQAHKEKSKAKPMDTNSLLNTNQNISKEIETNHDNMRMEKTESIVVTTVPFVEENPSNVQKIEKRKQNVTAADTTTVKEHPTEEQKLPETIKKEENQSPPLTENVTEQNKIPEIVLKKDDQQEQQAQEQQEQEQEQQQQEQQQQGQQQLENIDAKPEEIKKNNVDDGVDLGSDQDETDYEPKDENLEEDAGQPEQINFNFEQNPFQGKNDKTQGNTIKDETIIRNSNIPSHSMQDPFMEGSDSNFFTYFMSLMLICIIVYVAYHNKTKVIALVLEGRRSNGGGRGGSSIGRRKHTAAYRKLDTNLEEAITSNASGRTTQIIY